MATDLVVVYTPVGGGHKAAALATAEAARARGLSVEMLDLFALAPAIVGDTYVTTHLTGQSVAPNLYGSAYFAANRRDGAFEPVRRGFDHVVFAKLAKTVRALAPRAVIGTHHLPLVVLGRERRLGRLAASLVGVITDYTAHAIWAERGVDAFTVPCPRAERELAAHGIDASRIALTGIPVKAAFDAAAPAQNPARGERVRVLVTSGGFGVGPMRAAVRSFAGQPGVELTIVCGASSGLYARMREETARAGVVANVIGFEKDMASRVAAAHVVVGKAGGLTVSETLTAGRAMIVVGTVPGNETSNEEHVVHGSAGYAAEARDVGALVTRMRERGDFAQMGARARERVVHGAAARVVDVACAAARAQAQTETRRRTSTAA